MPEAFQRLWTLQRACEIQLASDAGRGPNRAIDAGVLERVPATRLKMNASGGASVATRLFDAMLRRHGIDFERDA